MKRVFLSLLLVASCVILALLLVAAKVNAGAIYIRERPPTGCVVSGYTGPGDSIAPQATVWYGLRAYNAAFGCNPAICVNGTTPNLCDGITHGYNVKILSNGNLDIAGALSSVAGSVGTGSCTIVGTTMTCATGTGALQQYGNITGAGLTYPAFLLSSCSSFPCTVTLNAAQTVAVAEPITAYPPIFISTFYDQSGANACSGSPCNVGPSSLSPAPALIANCQNSQPCIYDVAYNIQFFYGVPTLSSGLTEPVTFSGVGERTATFTSYAILGALCSSACTIGSTANNIAAAWNNSANQVTATSNLTGFAATASDSTAHAMQFLLNGASSVINVDGTETTGTVGTGITGTKVYLLSDDNGHGLTGFFMEFGAWASGLSQANRTLLCGNQAAYWGTTVGANC